MPDDVRPGAIAFADTPFTLEDARVILDSEMCQGAVPLRTDDQEITLFKSIGMALSDLVGAGSVYRAS